MFRYYLTFLFVAASIVLLPGRVAAATAPASASDCPKGSTCLQNPLGSRVEVTDIIGTIIKAALGVVGSLTLLMMVWGGFQWLTSAGNSEKIEAGSKTMLWAAVGVFLVFSSYLILTTFTNLLTGAR